MVPLMSLPVASVESCQALLLSFQDTARLPTSNWPKSQEKLTLFVSLPP